MRALKPNAMDHSHYVRIHMSATVPAGTSLEDVMTPTFWSHYAWRLKPNAIIEVVSEDGVLDCDLRIMEVGPTFAKVRLLRHFTEQATAEKAAPVSLDGVEVDFGGKADRWRVVHQGEVIKSGFATEKEAHKAAEEYRSKVAA